MEAVAGFGRRRFPLREVRLESLCGLLFINLDDGAKPLAWAYADFPDLSRYDTAGFVRAGRHDYEVAANWKRVCENDNECYRCSPAHPDLHRVST